MNKDEPSALQIARAVATYLTDELDRNPNLFIDVHREIAVCSLGIIKAAIDDLEGKIPRRR